MSIWGTVETDSWSRDLDYKNYLNLHNLSQTLGKVLCEEAYNKFCEMMDTQMNDSRKKGEI